MSTKIYDGMRLAKDVDPFLLIPKMREQFVPLLVDAGIRELTAAMMKDQADIELGRSKIEVSPLLNQFIVKAEDMQTSCTICLGFDSETGRHLLIPFADRSVINVLSAMDETEDYGYWNNSDRPEGVSARQWNERKRAWDRLIGYDAVADRTLTFSINVSREINTLDRLKRTKMIEKFLPTKEQRAEKHLLEILTKLVFDRDGSDEIRVMQLYEWARQTSVSESAQDARQMIESCLAESSMETFSKTNPGTLLENLPSIRDMAKPLIEEYSN